MDYAAQMVDQEIEKFERQIKKEYAKAQKDVEKQLKKHLSKYEKKDKQLLKKVKRGEISQETYLNWRDIKMIEGKRYSDLVRQLEDVVVNSNIRAAQMVNDATPRIYAENINFTEYQIEKGIKYKTSFSLYNPTAVRNAITKGDMVIPKANVNIPKDRLWNRKKIQSTLAQSVLKGDSIPEISRSLRDIVDSNRATATRTARTCMTAVQNTARIDGYEHAKELGIDVKKGWLATLDLRTRQSHRHLDGEIVELDATFSNGCRYPADPEGKPEEIYNCRCTLVPKIGSDKMLPMSMRFQRLPNDMSYEEWKGERQGSFAERIKEIARNVSGTPTKQEIHDAGKILAEEVNKEYKIIKDENDKANQHLKELKSERDKLENELDYMRHDFIYGSTADYKRWGCNTAEELQDKIVEWDNKYTEKIKEVREAIFAKNRKIKSRADCAEILKTKLSEVRDMGMTAEMKKVVTKKHLPGNSSMKKYVIQAYDVYPTDWVQKSINRGSLRVKKVSRGYYSDYSDTIAISGYSMDASFGTSLHELGHRFERAVPEIRNQEKLFYDERTKGESLEWLGSGYAKSEKTRKDDFVSPYMGKDYGGSAYELVSMGFQYAYGEPLKLMEDSDMQEWILGMLCLL